MQDFKTKYGTWAIVAGASEGLGAAFAEILAKRELNLILLARRPDKLKEVSDDLRNKYPIEILYYSIDLSDTLKTRQIISQLGKDVGLLVYNAAYAPIGYFEKIAEEDLEKIVDVNIKAPLLLSRLVISPMIEKRKGGIVLMSSLAGIQGSPKIATYAASKAFNSILAEGIWNELKKYGIDVLASSPGAVTTPGYKNAQHAKTAPGTLDAYEVAEKH